MKRLLLVLFSVSTLYQISDAQSFLRPHEWKRFKREVFFTIGTANFLGDLGGRGRKGTDYSPADLNINQSRTAFGVGYRYRFHKLMNVSTKLSYLHVKGDDKQTADIYRHNRNLNFRSNIFELTSRFEIGTQRIRRGGGHYGVQKNYARYRNISHGIYGFVGVTAFYFNPYGQDSDGKWVALYPLHTEGQGLPGGPTQYRRVSVAIPMGAFYKFTLKKIWSVGIEFCYRKTFTDYIDDVGSVYYDNNQLSKNYGPKSAEMADPSHKATSGGIYGATLPDASGNPAQRGDNEKDAYLTLEVTFGYTFKQQRKSARLRSKF